MKTEYQTYIKRELIGRVWRWSVVDIESGFVAGGGYCATKEDAVNDAGIFLRDYLDSDDRREALIAQLAEALPDWTFHRYGNSSECVAAYPPRELGVSFEAWHQVRKHALITAVCGPLYVVRQGF